MTGRPRIVASLTLVGLFALTFTGCGQASPPWSPEAASADQVIDGYVVGPARAAHDGIAFHQLEVAARTIWSREHPGQIVAGYSLHGGVLPDGSRQAGVEGPAMYVMIVDVVGGGRRALVIACERATLPSLDGCR